MIIYEISTPPVIQIDPDDTPDIFAIYQDYNYERFHDYARGNFNSIEPFGYAISHDGISVKGNFYHFDPIGTKAKIYTKDVVGYIGRSPIKRNGFICRLSPRSGEIRCEETDLKIPRGRIGSYYENFLLINPSKKKLRIEKKLEPRPKLIPLDILIKRGGNLECPKPKPKRDRKIDTKWKHPPVNPKEIPFPGITAVALFHDGEGWDEFSVPIDPNSTWDDILYQIDTLTDGGSLTDVKSDGGILTMDVNWREGDDDDDDE